MDRPWRLLFRARRKRRRLHRRASRVPPARPCRKPAGRGPQYASTTSQTLPVVPIERSEGRNPHSPAVVRGPRLRGGDSLLRRLFFLLRRRERAGVLDLGDILSRKAEHVGQNFVGVFAQERRALHLRNRIRQFDRIADRQIFAARRVIDFHHRAGFTQRWLRGDFLHRQDRTDRDIDRVAGLLDLELGLGQGPGFDAREDRLELGQPRARRGVFRIGLPGRFADQIADRAPDRRLCDEVDVGIGVFRRAFALKYPARLAAARIVAGARRGVAEGNALAVLAVFGERAGLEPLLVAQLDAAQIEHAVLHCHIDFLAAAGAGALIERRDNAEREMQARARIADLRAGDQRRPVAETSGRGRAAGALRDVFIDLAVLVGTRAEALDRGDDDARVDLVDALPGETHTVERAGREILNQHVALFNQRFQHAHALRVLGIDGDRALVVVEHGEIERVGAFDIDQLAAGDIADAGTLDLDHVGAEPGQQLRAGRARLHVGEIEDAHAGERLAVLSIGLG